MCESQRKLFFHKFCQDFVKEFLADCIRYPTPDEAQWLSNSYAARGFPGCLGSINVQDWEWRICTNAYKGHYTGKDKSILTESTKQQLLPSLTFLFGPPVSAGCKLA